ncbi:MAG TPA: CopG family transcriptional regulator [Ruminococcaceae bacterium]|nr:CopG family transcriptional regulator [Oscillospiraceae bacterium]
MEKRMGVVGIVVENLEKAAEINTVLHNYAAVIVGRMGIPYRERGVSVISLIVDGNHDQISAMTGKLGRIRGVTVKTALAKGRAAEKDG